jgi:hypothetical protein
MSRPTIGPLLRLKNSTFVVNYISIVKVMSSLCIRMLETVCNSISNGGFRKILAQPINLGSDILLLG